MDCSTVVFGQFWKMKLEIFGWVREKQVSTFMMEKHLLLIRNISTSLKQTDKQNLQQKTKVNKSNEPLTLIWQKLWFTDPQTHWWLIYVCFPHQH